LIYQKSNNDKIAAITHVRNLFGNEYEGGRYVLTFELCQVSSNEKEYQMTREAMSAINREMELSANESFLNWYAVFPKHLIFRMF